jgi:phosphoribosylformimino-5-aminoimidazole carboxamide ribotide isomerase
VDGKCVRLSQGDFRSKTVYSENPLEVAKRFEQAGITRLHMVDLDGAGGKPLKNLPVLEKVSMGTTLEIDFGGGLKDTDDLKVVFNAGASLVSLGSMIIEDPGLFARWIIDFGASKFLPGADVLSGTIRIRGWKEKTQIHVFDFIRELMSKGISRIFCTDISRDGMMGGPATGLYKEILEKFPSLRLIASGGISGYEDLLILREAGCSGAIVGKAFYEGKITLQQIADFNEKSEC